MSDPQGPSRTAARGAPHGRDRLSGDYWRLWTSSTASNLGDGMRLTALPLLAAAIDPRPLTVALLTAVTHLPWLVFALIAGAVADRVDRRRLMIRLQLVRVTVVLAFAVLLMTGNVTLVALLVVAVTMGVAEVFFDTTASTAMPAVVPTRHLERGNSRLFATEITANEFVGPPLGAALFAWRSTLPFWIAALGHAASAMLLARIGVSFNAAPDEKTSAAPRPSLRRSIGEGLRVTRTSPFLRAWTVMIAATNLARAMTVAVFVLYVLQLLDGNELLFGVLSAMVAIGGVLGSWGAERTVQWLGRTATVVTALAATIVSHILLGTVVNVGAAAVAGVLIGSAVAVTNVVFVSVRQAVVPRDFLGRVGSVQRFVTWGALPIGALLGGWLAEVSTLRVPYLTAAGIVAVTAAFLWRRLVDFPTQPLSINSADRGL